MKFGENILYIAVLAVFGLIGIWLQTGIMDESPATQSDSDPYQPDYYIENFTATGMDENGNRSYILEAERMAHFPHDGTALLDQPHVIEYNPGLSPRHTYADSGWVSADGDEILLTGNVKIVQEADARGPGGTMQAQRMRILLDESANRSGLLF